jgi:hypothetical protein
MQTMKSKIFLLSALVSLCSTGIAVAADPTLCPSIDYEGQLNLMGQTKFRDSNEFEWDVSFKDLPADPADTSFQTAFASSSPAKDDFSLVANWPSILPSLTNNSCVYNFAYKLDPSKVSSKASGAQLDKLTGLRKGEVTLKFTPSVTPETTSPASH